MEAWCPSMYRTYSPLRIVESIDVGLSLSIRILKAASPSACAASRGGPPALQLRNCQAAWDAHLGHRQGEPRIRTRRRSSLCPFSFLATSLKRTRIFIPRYVATALFPRRTAEPPTWSRGAHGCPPTRNLATRRRGSFVDGVRPFYAPRASPPSRHPLSSVIPTTDARTRLLLETGSGPTRDGQHSDGPPAARSTLRRTVRGSKADSHDARRAALMA